LQYLVSETSRNVYPLKRISETRISKAKAEEIIEREEVI
jgi:hypothetical protein